MGEQFMEKPNTRRTILSVIFLAFLTLIGSFYFDLIVTALWGTLSYLTLIKEGVLVIGTLVFFLIKDLRKLAVYPLILVGVTATTLLNEYLQTLSWVNHYTSSSSFVGNIGGNVTMKLLSSILMVLLFFVLFKKPQTFYLVPGDLKVKAEPISFLGISKNWVSWGKLAPISGGLIAVVTIALAILTVTGTGTPLNFPLFLKVLPFIFLFAAVNSFCEGILFRHGTLASLTGQLPKEVVLILSAVYFGSFHYYGAPGGIVGVIMSSILGWFMARSLFETKGFAAPWIIHFMQDFVIFSTLALLGTFTF